MAVMKEGEAGAKVADLCRKYGMSGASYHGWCSTGLGVTSTPQSETDQKARYGTS